MKLLLTVMVLVFVASNSYAQEDDELSWGELDAARVKGAAVEYVPPERLKIFPMPVVLFVNDKEGLEGLSYEVVDKIIYPFLCENEVPIMTIKVDLCPTLSEDGVERGCDKNRDGELMIRLDINGTDGSSSMRLIERNKAGGLDKDSYLKLFPTGFVPKRRCATEGGEE